MGWGSRHKICPVLSLFLPCLFTIIFRRHAVLHSQRRAGADGMLAVVARRLYAGQGSKCSGAQGKSARACGMGLFYYGWCVFSEILWKRAARKRAKRGSSMCAIRCAGKGGGGEAVRVAGKSARRHGAKARFYAAARRCANKGAKAGKWRCRCRHAPAAQAAKSKSKPLTGRLAKGGSGHYRRLIAATWCQRIEICDSRICCRRYQVGCHPPW